MRGRLPYGDALRAALGAPGRARRLESSPRSRVWRVELAGGPAVLKQLVAGPGARDRYDREVTALRLAGRRATGPVVPALLGTDPDELVLVLEHLEHGRPGPEWIVPYAAALARLHACAPEDPGALPRWRGPGAADIAAFLGFAERLGAAVPAGAEGEMGALVERLGAAVPDALLHGDPCPGNDLHTPAGIRFVDFEQACVGSGLAELAYLRIGFPTCACVTSAAGPLRARAEEAYRAVWRAERGEDVPEGLADACAGWVLRGDALVPKARRDSGDQLARAARRDWTWGTTTARARLAHRLEVLASLGAEHPELSGLGELAARMRSRMHDRWPRLAPVPSVRP
ncbi:aminoglycoside phosphotransferase family protein [Streptomyces sp. G-G2]|uniref:phosphotransferase family protein n=1 Tax=Streptomyces sp. G-G2 TaxID=3046201 RepID=UPI0024BA658B|nr:aminoglycoside phosphotransferase family protein [Streptomyces sp. G-G2]MDJ0379976.1 aminoglycoside phosphotransferase family protein [Streptomyces sp. G-G2]